MGPLGYVWMENLRDKWREGRVYFSTLNY